MNATPQTASSGALTPVSGAKPPEVAQWITSASRALCNYCEFVWPKAPRTCGEVEEAFEAIIAKHVPQSPTIPTEGAAKAGEIHRTPMSHTMACEFPEGCTCGASQFNSLLADLAAATERVKRLERENLDHAEDWAFCGLNHQSQTAQGLILRDRMRKIDAAARDFIAWICPLFKEKTPETHPTLVKLLAELDAARAQPTPESK